MELAVNGLWPRGLRHGSRGVEQAFVGKGLALFGSVGQRAFAQSLHALERPREVWATVSCSFFLLKKEPMVLGELIEFGPCISAETVKACALIGLHMMAEENAIRTGILHFDRAEMWNYGCPKSPVWSDDGLVKGKT